MMTLLPPGNPSHLIASQRALLSPKGVASKAFFDSFRLWIVAGS